MINVDNGSTSDACMFKHHLLRHGLDCIIIFPQCEIFVAASLIIYWSHSLLGANDFRVVIHFQEPVTSGESISSRGESLAPRSK